MSFHVHEQMTAKTRQRIPHMDTIRIRSCFSQDVTVISNDFLDRFLPQANGDFLKIYLYILRTAGMNKGSLSLTGIADRMNCTENDVLRSIRYWQKEGVLDLKDDEEGNVSEIAFISYCKNPGPEEETILKPSDISSERIAKLNEKEDVRELFYIAQQYIGRPLTKGESQKICYFYDQLGFSSDLIDYLIEYCVSRGHGNFSYIEKVALNWHKEGISSVRDARLAVQNYHREYYDILKALGLDNHHPVEEEIRIMKQWLEKYNFPMSMIREACSRTIMGAGKPSLKYADGILSKWYRAGVRSFEDIERLDAEHARSGIAATQKKNARAPKPTAFNSFEQRKDDDNLDELLLKKTRALYGSMNKEE